MVPLLLFLWVVQPTRCFAWSENVIIASTSRRAASSAIAAAFLVGSTCTAAVAVPVDKVSNESTGGESFVSLAYGRQEYTNAIAASRDTNLSPAEAYDVIRQRIPMAAEANRGVRTARALDLGAGAGLSTAILFSEKGYRNIAAVDWSRTAWDASVMPQPVVGNEVRFYEMDDITFFGSLPSGSGNAERFFDVIVYNFAVNQEKAVWVAQNFLFPKGLLLAPCNDKTDYWYKQTYVLLDHTGNAVWTSDATVGAWSVQFQPDVTSPNCTGIWCGTFNGFFAEHQRRL